MLKTMSLRRTIPKIFGSEHGVSTASRKAVYARYWQVASKQKARVCIH